jgi:hypothetical protein
MSEKLVNITWGIPLEPETPNEFLNLDIAQYSKGDCSQTFFLESDGQFERTENLFALATTGQILSSKSRKSLRIN